ncbi:MULTISPECIES: adenylate/guanylate cyclase domain-containing protein [unclassified Ensifer]|uniref:adenylate/guanylate cyclase domain-containing protein n=1 Tax=unclassified Ensifer TaxID=2633371 RepID=UPI000812C48A|nr:MULTISPECIES: adenylate/guanylate cyclase domain-containing protein [unclassified Ensifer]OCO98683.1 adenylate cyclase [Ensifer sp. LC14]OCP13162.1 adenylate cyclase [Ensifer sp. LC13]OCP13767.1 adenylate cyclase [Ensifer sp. LC11]OCP28143.1 adenylate cyclase [Ensifer sp. LC499]
MSETRRKLTTIFSADVQDYTRLMRADEEGTLATLKRHRDAMGRLIEAHHGRVVNTWGDGLIAEFPSVVEALRAAIDVQNELAGRNAKCPVEEQMLFRIGINLGDVIAEGDDLYGDGVNVAARLQASAPAGGIVISNTVYDQVRNKVAVGFDFLGALEVKNIDGGVPSYAVRIGTADARPAIGISGFGRSNGTAAPGSARAGAGSSAAGGKVAAARRGSLPALTIIAAGLVALNLLTWNDAFWSIWPLLGLGILWGLAWLKQNPWMDRGIGVLALAGLVLLTINLLTWRGVFWAVWPLLAFAVVAGIRWVTRSRRSVGS